MRAVVAWRDANRAPQAHHRVEHGADGIRERPAVDDRHWIANVVPASEKPRAVRFELQVADGFAFHNDHVRGPNGSLFVGLPAARRQQRADIWHEFGLHKQVGECRMCHIGRLGRQAKLGIGSDLNFARARSQVGDGDSAHLRIILGRHDDFERGGQRAVAPDNLGAVFGKGGLISGRAQRRSADSPPTTLGRSAHREERCRCPSSRAWHPPASA